MVRVLGVDSRSVLHFKKGVIPLPRSSRENRLRHESQHHCGAWQYKGSLKRVQMTPEGIWWETSGKRKKTGIGKPKKN